MVQDIANLVKKGLRETLQRGLDIVRAIGNSALPPGQVEIRDDSDMAVDLCGLINLVADVTIAQPREADALHSVLPDSSNKHIENRDAQTGSTR